MCGIVGIYHKKEPACGDVYDALIQVQHRGQDAAGISTWDTEKISTHKYTGLVTEVFKHQKTFDKLAGNIGIGHVRYPTAGGDNCLLYTSPSPRDAHESRMPSSA